MGSMHRAPPAESGPRSEKASHQAAPPAPPPGDPRPAPDRRAPTADRAATRATRPGAPDCRAPSAQTSRPETGSSAAARPSAPGPRRTMRPGRPRRCSGQDPHWTGHASAGSFAASPRQATGGSAHRTPRPTPIADRPIAASPNSTGSQGVRSRAGWTPRQTPSSTAAVAPRGMPTATHPARASRKRGRGWRTRPCRQTTVPAARQTIGFSTGQNGLTTTSTTMVTSRITGASLNQRYQTWLRRWEPCTKRRNRRAQAW